MLSALRKPFVAAADCFWFVVGCVVLAFCDRLNPEIEDD